MPVLGQVDGLHTYRYGLLSIPPVCMTRERRGQEFAVKVFLESNEKDYNKNCSFRLQGREDIES